MNRQSSTLYGGRYGAFGQGQGSATRHSSRGDQALERAHSAAPEESRGYCRRRDRCRRFADPQCPVQGSRGDVRQGARAAQPRPSPARHRAEDGTHVGLDTLCTERWSPVCRTSRCAGRRASRTRDAARGFRDILSGDLPPAHDQPSRVSHQGGCRRGRREFPVRADRPWPREWGGFRDRCRRFLSERRAVGSRDRGG